MTFIIDVPLSLTNCSGRDRQSVVVKWRERDTLVQRHSLLMCHCHLLSAVVEIDKVWQYTLVQLLMCHCHLLSAVVEIDKVW